MPIPIIYEDSVDWEPLNIRFVPGRTLAGAELRRIAEFINSWMDNAATSDPYLWISAKEWACTVSDDDQIIARCEFFPEKEITRLAEELHAEFPSLKEMRLGSPHYGSAITGDFDWYRVPADATQLEESGGVVQDFEISSTAVTLGQFTSFLEATGYTPMPDKIEECPNYLVDHFTLNFGPSPKQPLYGVTYDDALSFCEWAGLRLPTDTELKNFFHFACLNKKSFKYTGTCWTSTARAKDHYVTRDGPYRENQLDAADSEFRTTLHRHHYEQLEAPCFRVVRSIST